MNVFFACQLILLILFNGILENGKLYIWSSNYILRGRTEKVQYSKVNNIPFVYPTKIYMFNY